MEFVYDGNVDVKSGDIRFDGDVRIGEDVENSMFVGASGKVFIAGAVQKSTVEAGTSAIIGGNVLSSTVTVGMERILKEELAKQLNGLVSYLERVNAKILEIKQDRDVQLTDIDMKEIKELVRVNLKEDYLDFQHGKFEFIQKAKNYASHLTSDWELVIEKLYTIFTDTSMTVVRNGEQFTMLLEEARALVKLNLQGRNGDSLLRLPYATNSVLSCNGSIEVTELGLHNCSVTAKKQVTVEGCCRGGVIVASEKVSIKESGSTTGVKTVIKTEKSGTITIGLARCGTEIWVGDDVHHICADQLGVHARMIEGRLRIN